MGTTMVQCMFDRAYAGQHHLLRHGCGPSWSVLPLFTIDLGQRPSQQPTVAKVTALPRASARHQHAQILMNLLVGLQKHGGQSGTSVTTDCCWVPQVHPLIHCWSAGGQHAGKHR